MVFLGSTNIGGHDYVEYRAANPTNHGCDAWMRTYLPNGSFYDHDWVTLPAYGSYNSYNYRDSGVRTQACVDQPNAGDSRACTVT